VGESGCARLAIGELEVTDEEAPYAHCATAPSGGSSAFFL